MDRKVWAFVLTVAAAACASSGGAATPAPSDAGAFEAGTDGGRHDTILACTPVQGGDPATARVPPPYAGMTNPLRADAVQGGAALFRIWCARCHGLDAKGDRRFDPPPADLTASFRADDYLFWRISEGGQGDPICSQMPSFKGSLSTDERWQLVSYLHTIEPNTKDAGDE